VSLTTVTLLAAFAARLTEELDADAVTEDLARSVHTALEPAHVSIWLSERSPRLRASPSIPSRPVAERAAPDGHDLSFRFGVAILFAEIRSLLAAGPGRP
jgi:hypothetical protein